MIERTDGIQIGDFLASRGGPFYELQRRLGLLREEAFRARSRALIFVVLAWGVPLIMTLIAGNAFGTYAESPYLLDLRSWGRFFIAVGLFVLMEKQVEDRLNLYLQQFTRAPLLAPGSFAPAAAAVTKALKQRDAFIAEAICLALAIVVSFALYFRVLNTESAFWAVQLSQQGSSLAPAGWWLVTVSNPIFVFLLLRILWRLFVWSMLLRELAALELRLIATHPDGHGGLAFLGHYPNAYTMFVFAISCALGSIIAHELLDNTLNITTYGYLMGGGLVLMLTLFTFPLASFLKPLSDMKERTLLAYSGQATRYHRAVERNLVGENICASGDAERAAANEIPDPSKELASARKLSVFLINREGLLPISAAATQLPFKEIMNVLKRLLLP